MKKRTKFFVVIVAMFLAAQAVPVSRENPTAPEEWEVDAPEQVMRILKRSCYDCHSNKVKWPFYAYVAPVSWLVAYDVSEGREKVNFSEWSQLSDRRKRNKAEESAELAESEDMPLPVYIWLHNSASLSPEEKEAIRDWADNL